MLNEEDMFDDLAYDQAEGAAEAYDEFEETDEFDEADEADEFDEADEGEEYAGFEESEEEDDAFDTVVANALAAEDADEFLRRLRRGARAVAQAARRAAPVVGQIARVAGPVLRRIPHPYAQVAGRVAGVLGRLMADGASEEEALDAMAEYAVRDRRALPAVAGLAIRAVSRGATARMPAQARLRAVRAVRRSVQGLVQQRGPAAARAITPIVRSVRRTAAVRRTPALARPQVLRRTVRRVAQSPGMARRLSRPSPQARATLRRAGAAPPAGGQPAQRGAVGVGRSRSMTFRGPVRITITRG